MCRKACARSSSAGPGASRGASSPHVQLHTWTTFDVDGLIPLIKIAILPSAPTAPGSAKPPVMNIPRFEIGPVAAPAPSRSTCRSSLVGVPAYEKPITRYTELVDTTDPYEMAAPPVEGTGDSAFFGAPSPSSNWYCIPLV